jgi:hypothetical protein
MYTTNIFSFCFYFDNIWMKASRGSTVAEPLTTYHEIKALNTAITRQRMNELKRTILVLLESKGIFVDIQL